MKVTAQSAFEAPREEDEGQADEQVPGSDDDAEAEVVAG